MYTLLHTQTHTHRTHAQVNVTTQKYCLLVFLTEGRKEGRGVVLECRSDYWNGNNQFPACGVCHKSHRVLAIRIKAMFYFPSEM